MLHLSVDCDVDPYVQKVYIPKKKINKKTMMTLKMKNMTLMNLNIK